MAEKKNEKRKIKKYEWELTEVINPSLTEEEIKHEFNKKLAYIIIELEHNPVNYILKEYEERL